MHKHNIKFYYLLLVLMLLASVTLVGCKVIKIGGNQSGETGSADTISDESLPKEKGVSVHVQISDNDQGESKGNSEDAENSGNSEGDETSEALFEKFLNNEMEAFGKDGDSFFYKDMYESEATEFDVGPTFYDLDNDGEDEMILMNYYGGRYFDARDGRVYLFAEGEGTAYWIYYIEYSGYTWVYHCDISHGGRELYWFDRYQGADCVVESFSMYDEFWGGEEHTYSLNEEEISMEEYKALYEGIFKEEYVPREY